MTSLVKKIDQRLASAGKTPRPLGAYIIFVNNAAGLDNRLRGIAQTESLKHVSLSIGPPPKNYDVSNEADMTVMIYTVGRRWEQHVTANFAFREGELDEAKTGAIVKALSDVLPK